MKRLNILLFTLIIFLTNSVVFSAELPWQFNQHTRFMVMGDSLGSGYGALPQTKGYAYQLYQSGRIAQLTKTLFCNASVIGVTSAEVLKNQIPQAYIFRPDVVTLTVGGNDLAKILEGANPEAVLFEFQNNLASILYHLVIELGATVYIANLYVIDNIPGAEMIIPVFNQIVDGVAANYGISVADIYSHFLDKQGLLLIDRQGASSLEVHPTNSGHTVIAKTFADLM